MARTQATDPGKRLVKALAGEIREVARSVAPPAQFAGLSDSPVVTRVGLDGDGNPTTVTGFMIGFSAIGGPDAIYSEDS